MSPVRQILSILLIFIGVALPSNKLFSQNISFKKLGLDEGLSEIAGLCIQQDSIGRMWVGTRNGLNCWDGIRMKTYYPERGDTTTLMEHKVTKLCLNGKFLWAQSAKGLSRLNLNTMQFKRFEIDKMLSVGKFNNEILVGTSVGLFVYDKRKEQFVAATKIFDEKIEIANIYQDKNKTLWLASSKKHQIFRIEDGIKKVIPVPVGENFPIYQLLLDSRNKLWIATRFRGLLVYDNTTNKFERITTDSSPFFINDLAVRSLVEDNEGRLWIGTFKGIAIFDLAENTTSFIRSSANDDYSLSHNSVYSLYLSNDNNIWVGSYFGGVNYGRVSNEIFQKYHLRASSEKPSHMVMGQLVEDEKGNVWIATEGGGIDYFNREKNTFTNYSATNSNNGPSQTNIKSLFLDAHNQQLLIGTFRGGLNVLDIKHKKFKHYKNQINNINAKSVSALCKYGDDYLLGSGHGVLLYKTETEEFVDFFQSEGCEKLEVPIFALYIDSKGIIWLGTEYNGLVAYNPKTKVQRKYKLDEFNTKALPNNTINCIMEDHRFRLWMGTDGGGLCLYDRTEDSFKTFNKQRNNLPSDFIYGVVESRFGNLWIATSKGLSRFDVENNQFFNYTSESGFPLKELNYKSLLLTQKGDLFVGGVDGLISFKERDLLLIDEDLKVNLSSLFVNNKEVVAFDDTNILSQDISMTKSFTLKPKHTIFSINFSAFNYNNNLNNKYQYKLDGFNEDWINSEFVTTATYTNLNPGVYTFKVRATDVAYNPIAQERSLLIKIQPPIAKTWYAYCLYVALLLLLIIMFNHFYLGKVRVQDRLKTEMEDKDRITELNVHKLRFFTNISHEFMTPLTIILSSLESIFSKNKLNSSLKEPLTQILRNAKRLKYLNSELLDFRKIEQGHLKLRVQENDVVPYLEDIYETFAAIAQVKEIELKLDTQVKTLPVFYDTVQMDKVFFNLLSNAINHVESKSGQITIELNDFNNKIEILIVDNGAGIPKEDVPKVFNRFFHHESKYVESEYQGSGIGLALSQSIVHAHKGTIVCESEENVGTTFTLTLLKGDKHVSEAMLSNRPRSTQFSIDKELIWIPEESEQDEELAESSSAQVNSPLLLVVDDNSEIRHAVKNLFSAQFKVITAKDGKDGFEKASENQPEIIISDVLMPKMSGFEMCRKLKRNLITSHIPVLLLTALDSEEDRTIAFKHGADSYCSKPFNSEMLTARVENLFKNRRRLQEKYNSDPGASTESVTQNVVDKEFLEKTQKVIEQNLLNPKFSVDEFATEMQLGRTIFYNKVKTITGQTPNDYIQTIRLKKAADMLIENPNKNVSEVAYETGFNSPKYFSTAFKKHFGVTPSQFGKR